MKIDRKIGFAAFLALALLFALATRACAQQTIPPFNVDYFQLNGVSPQAGYCPVGVSPTDVQWALCDFSSVPVPIAIADGGTDASTADAAMSNLLSNPAAGNYEISCTSDTLCIPSAAARVFVTDPPFNAACDGSTDATASINAAWNSSAAEVDLPVSANDDIQECMHSGTLEWPATGLTFEGNNSYLTYTGTGTGINIDAAVAEPFAVIKDVQLGSTAATGSPIGIGSPAHTGNAMLYNVQFLGTTNADALALSIEGEEDIYLYGVYGFSGPPFLLGASVTANHLEFSCTTTSQTGLTIPESYIGSYSGVSLSGCKYGISAATTFAGENITFNSLSF